MILSIATAALVAGVTVDPVCVWNDRGLHRVTVPVASLVDNYTDIPKVTRDRLKARIERYQYDEMAVISREGVASDVWQYSGMSYMHFGSGRRVCGQVRTDHWADGDVERGMVYEQDGYTLIVPTVCSNLARVTRTVPTRRDRGAELQEELETAALFTPIPVSLLTEIPDLPLTLPPVETRTVEDLGDVARGWPEPELLEIWARPPLYGEPLVFSRVAFDLGGAAPVPGVSPADPAPVDIPEGDLPSPVAPVPEPGTWALMLLGLWIVARWVRPMTKEINP